MPVDQVLIVVERFPASKINSDYVGLSLAAHMIEALLNALRHCEVPVECMLCMGDETGSTYQSWYALKYWQHLKV
jgi:hypothetical protein